MRYAAISASYLDDIMKCDRNAYFSRELKIAPAASKETLMRGSLFHHILEVHYTLKREDVLDYQSIIDNATNAGELYALNECPELDSNVANFWIDNYRNGYAPFYKDEKWKILSIEEPFAKVIYESEDVLCDFCKSHGFEDATNVNCKDCTEGLTLAIEGKMDLHVYNEVLNIEHPVDHKTVDRNDPIDGRTNQFFAYTWKSDCRSIIVNRVGSQKDEKLRYSRPSVSIPQVLKDEWAESVVSWYLRWEAVQKSQVYAPNYTSCRFCSFREICDTTPETRPYIIETMYRKKGKFDLFEKR